MSPFIQILDGGLGTSLEDNYNIHFDSSSTPLWSSHLLVSKQGQATLLACQRDFAAVPVDVLLTATYQVSIEGFARTRTDEFPDGVTSRDAVARYLADALDIAESAAAQGSSTCSRTATSNITTAAAAAAAAAATTTTTVSTTTGCERAEIALSLGPYGACMVPGQEYSGRYDAAHDGEEELVQWHLERLRLFGDADVLRRVRYVAFETLPRLDELRAVRRAVHAAGITVPFWVSCVFPDPEGEGEEGKETGLRLPDGSTVEQVVHAALAEMGDGAMPWGVGINCTKVHKLPALVDRYGRCVEQMLAAGQIRAAPALVLYPDGTKGEVYNTTTQRWEKKGDWLYSRPWEEQLAQVVRDAQRRRPFSSFIVGGCCKASHHDIKRLRAQFK
ncbi:hypothetical protein VTO42DRAFT_754 [Malbranchea cinnamomea]